MTKKWTSATVAALGGMTAAIALFSGLSTARADELGDLRANQDLLQRRIDQLAQATPTGGVAAPIGGPGVGVPMAGGSFPRSFLIPGTDTSIRVGGEVTEVLDYWFTGGPPNGSPQTTTVGDTGQAESVPLHVHTAAGNPARSRGNSIFQQSPRQSKLLVETRTPTAWGEARTYVEFDFAGSTVFNPGGARGALGTSDSLAPRLRFAYGTLGGFLGGQANSNFSDPDGSPETLDFGGNFGDPGFTRTPQIRYTMPLANWWSLPGALSFSAETPETDAVTAGGIIGSDRGAVATTAATIACPVVGAVASCAVAGNLPGVNPTKASTPDLTMAWYIPQAWGHMDFSAVVRPGMQFKDGAFVDRQYIGYGVHFGGDVKPGWFGWARDDITFHFVYGDGIGRYLNASTNFALISNYPAAAAPATAAAANNVLTGTTVEWGGNVGYQHRWSNTLRSTASFGINHHDIDSRIAGCAAAGAATGAGNCGLNKEMITAHMNLIWNPVPFADVGIEYVYGHRVVLSNLKGDENVLISRFRVQF
jgi:hypothetical protein